ncbi:MAG: PASTA domain-containing protein [Candidatus Competibacter denitrificans]
MRSKINFLSMPFLLFLLGLLAPISQSFGACSDPVPTPGPGETTVPNVLGSVQSGAVTTILGAGLTIGTITQVVTPSNVAANGIVISQSPVQGICVTAGSPVNLSIAINPVTVPNVVGQPQSAATAAITAAGLTLGAVTTQNNTTVPAGTVLSQNPAAGATANPGAAVALVVATGSTLVNVPNVIGLSQAGAALTIQGTCTSATTPATCLTVGTVTQQASTTVPAGQVISQSPAPNSPVEASTSVNLWVSSGPPVTVPNVVGQPQGTAADTLVRATLTVGTVTQEFSATVPAGQVISQNPPANAAVAPGTPVNLVISTGPKPTTVPNVTGQSLTGAKTTLTGVGLVVGSVTLAASSTVPAGTVIGQNPAGGSQVAPGSTINLTISAGPAAPETPKVTPGDIEVPNVIGLSKAIAAATLHKLGLSFGATIQKFDAKVPAGTIIDQSPAAGVKVGVGTAVTVTVSLGPAGVVKVPDVTGLPAEAARSILQSAGLTVGNTLTQPDPSVPLNNVIKTIPAAGTQVNAGASVDLVASSGATQAQQCTVPDIVNQTVEDARQIVFATCLSTIGSTTVRTDPTIPAGKVAAQVPAAGTLVGYNTTINLIVSSGSQPPVVTPRVIGLTLADATIVLNSAGLTVGFVSRQTSNTVPEGRIISQNPLMTAPVPVGWLVNLIVSLGPIPDDPAARPQTQVPDVTKLTLAAATAKLIEANLKVGLVSNQRSTTIPAGQVTRQSVAPNTTVPINSRVNLAISFGPYAYGLFSGPAYITNHIGNTVSILDPDTNQIADNLPTGSSRSGPSGVAIHPDGTKLYITNRSQFGGSAGTVSVIDLIERKVAALIPVGVAPLGVAINPTGERVFVANEGSFSLSVIDTGTNQPFIDLSVPNLAANSYPRGVAVHPNPLRPLVYVTNRTVNSFSDDQTNPYVDQCDALVGRSPVNVNPDQCVGSLSIFDADLKIQVGSVAVGWAPEGVAVHPDGALVYVANSGDRTVSVVDTVFNRVIGIINLDEFGGAPQPLVPRGIAVSPDGNRLYVSDGAGNRLFVIDTTANHVVVGIIPVGKKPYGVAVSADSKRIYVANTDDNTVSVVDGQSQTIIATIPTGLGPWGFGQFVGPLSTVATPVLDPAGGTFPGNVMVKISTTTSGASIRYTTDGSTPTPTSGIPLVSGQSVPLSAQIANVKVTLKAIAFKDNWADSDVAQGTYRLNTWLSEGENSLP